MARRGVPFCSRLSLLVLGLAWASGAAAQDVEPGHRLRVTAPALEGGPVVGELVRLDADSLVLDGAGGRWAAPRALITGAERHDGRHGHTLHGALIGGLATAAFIGQDMLRKPGQCEGSGNYGELCAIWLVGGALAGAGLGALVGTAIRHDDWVTVSLGPAWSGGARTFGGGVAVGIGVRVPTGPPG